MALQRGEYLGTITLRPPAADSQVDVYRDPGTWSISQFAVAPQQQGAGLGRRLHDEAVARARAAGAKSIALDTAAPARRLIDLYSSWGYELIGQVDWRPKTNYPSVLMRLSLSDEAQRSTPGAPHASA